jgi:DNA-binding CsgD family transcriptional regulator
MFEPLTRCETRQALTQVAQGLLQELGFELWSLAVQVLPSAVAGDEAVFTFDNLPEALRAPRLRAFFANAREPADVRRQHGIPWEWLTAGDAPPGLAPGHAQLREAAQRAGVHGGLCISSISSDAQPACVLLATTRPVDEAALRAAAPAALLFSRYLHLACQPHILAHKLQRGPRLSPRETECLYWAACGKTAWEIGRVLEISEHTAIYHLRNAGLKLGAVSRQQAVAEATRLGILAPLASAQAANHAMARACA